MANIDPKQISKIIAANVRLTKLMVFSGENEIDVTSSLSSVLNTAGHGGESVPLQVSSDVEQDGVLIAGESDVLLRGFDTHEPIVSDLGNEVFARLFFDGVSSYSLSFFEWIANSETPYTFTSAVEIDVEIPYRFKLHQLPTDFFVKNKIVSIGQDPSKTRFRGNFPSAPPSPVDGDLYYNTVSKVYLYYNGSVSSWFQLQTSEQPFVTGTKAQRLSIVTPIEGQAFYQTDDFDKGLFLFGDGIWYSVEGEIVTEHFITATGERIHLISNTNGGGQVIATTSNNLPNVGSPTLYNRQGLALFLTAGTGSSRGNVYRQLGQPFTSPSRWYYEAELIPTTPYSSVTDNAVSHFMNFESSLDLANNTTGANAIYLRMGYTNEATQSVKLCVRVSGIESVLWDSGVGFVASSFIKGVVYWDGLNLTYWVSTATQTVFYTVNNLLATYPSLNSSFIVFSFRNSRAVNAPAGVQRGVAVDTLRSWIPDIPFHKKRFAV